MLGACPQIFGGLTWMFLVCMNTFSSQIRKCEIIVIWRIGADPGRLLKTSDMDLSADTHIFLHWSLRHNDKECKQDILQLNIKPTFLIRRRHWHICDRPTSANQHMNWDLIVIITTRNQELHNVFRDQMKLFWDYSNYSKKFWDERN